MTMLRTTALGVSVLLVACATTPDTASTLSGTSWRLVELQSMDDAQGTIRTDEPDRYTIVFGADDTAFMKLDCNRGRSSFEAEGTGPDQGSLVFGQIASTMALCPPESLGERLSQQLGFVRSYVIRGDRLIMVLLADGGLLVWERAESGEP